MTNYFSRARGRVRRYLAPLPLNDFEEYDGYWDERERYEPKIHPRWVLAAKKISDGATVLDVGCGTGGFLTYLVSQKPSVKVTGTDVSDRAVKVARAAGLNAFQADLTREPISGEYDYVTCFETIEHIHEAEKVLVSMRDVTRRQLIMSLPNLGYVGHRVRLGVFGQFPNTALAFHAKEHIRHWTVKDFVYWAGVFGLRVVQVEGQQGFRYLPWRRFPALFSGQVVYTLSRTHP